MGKQMKRLFYICFALLVLLMSWEQQNTTAALVEGPIPEDSIRLRIIANSDSPQDQWLKMKVRDQVVNNITTWVGELKDKETAKQVIESHLPEIEQIVKNTIEESGFSYTSTVMLGEVPFPTKLYGQYVYPAGEYDALRITIGQALGKNWWCVLFPPLCFVDMSNGDPIEPGDKAQATQTDSGQPHVGQPDSERLDSKQADSKQPDPQQPHTEQPHVEQPDSRAFNSNSATVAAIDGAQPQVRFFLFDVIKKLLSFFS